MPIRNNRNIRKSKPHVVRNMKKKVVNRNNKPSSSSKHQPINTDSKYSVSEKIWDNETVYIVGGGPSLKSFKWDKLKCKNVIAINRAYEMLPGATVLYWTDSRFYKWYKDDINKFKGLKYTCRPFNDKPSDVKLLKPTSAMKIDIRPSFICHGNNSGYGAINLAIKLGAKKIYLLGYDMNSSPNTTHWHDGYTVKHNHTIYQKMIKYFDTMPSELKKLGVQVFNANPKSQLTCFRKCSLNDALNDTAFNPYD